jgi:hypothetical protein
MKPLLSLMFVLCLVHTDAFSQSSVKKIYSQLKKTERCESVSLPGWIIKLGLRFVRLDDELASSGIFNLARKIQHVRVATASLDSKRYNTKAILNNFIKSVQRDDHFEEYMNVRSENQNLKIMVQTDNDVIKNLLILGEHNGEISMVHLKANIKPEDLKQLSFDKFKPGTDTESGPQTKEY